PGADPDGARGGAGARVAVVDRARRTDRGGLAERVAAAGGAVGGGVAALARVDDPVPAERHRTDAADAEVAERAVRDEDGVAGDERPADRGRRDRVRGEPRAGRRVDREE